MKLAPYAYVAPFFLLFFAFGLFPLVYTGWVSLHSVGLQNTEDMQWVGLDNYSRLIHDHAFWNALLNTFTIGLISTVPQLLIALGLAHLLSYKLRGSTFFRVSMLMPYATSVAAATIVFAMLFGRDFGLINWFLGLFGIANIDWENGRWSSQIAISTIVTWRWTGYNALIYLAAIAGDPEGALRGGGGRRREPLAAVPARDDPRHQAGDRLHGRHLDDRRDAALRRAAALRRRRRLPGRRTTTSTRHSACSSTSRAGSTSSSAGPPRPPGRCS